MIPELLAEELDSLVLAIWYMMIPELLAEELDSLVLAIWYMMIPELLAEELHSIVVEISLQFLYIEICLCLELGQFLNC
jgi:hypothetical protein